MKKVLLMFTTVLFMSCEKSYQCECTTINKSGPIKSSSETETVRAKNKDAAYAKCTSADEVSTSYEVTCHLK